MAPLLTLDYEAYRVCLFPDDIECYVKGPRLKWVMLFGDGQQKPPIPPIWPVKLGTNLTRPEIYMLENVGFQLPSKERITPTHLFTNSAPPLDMSCIQIQTIPTPSLLEGCPRLFSDPTMHLQQSRGRWLPLLKLCKQLF